VSQNQQTSNTVIIAGVAGAIVVALLIAAVILGGSLGDAGNDSPITAEQGTPEVSGLLPPMPQQGGVDQSATGAAAPTVTGEDFDNSAVAIQSDGRPKAIVFLAHWCPHCQTEVPSVQAWLDATGGVDGVDMYSVTTAIDPARTNYPPSDWLEGERWTVPVIRDDQDGSVLRAYGAGAFPYWVFTNSDGTVALRVAGAIPIADLEQILRSLS
jgi:thiol-disulfide isomerase/thioredoxin